MARREAMSSLLRERLEQFVRADFTAHRQGDTRPTKS